MFENATIYSAVVWLKAWFKAWLRGAELHGRDEAAVRRERRSGAWMRARPRGKKRGPLSRRPAAADVNFWCPSSTLGFAPVHLCPLCRDLHVCRYPLVAGYTHRGSRDTFFCVF